MREDRLKGIITLRGVAMTELQQKTYNITPSVLTEWQMAECGSWEDHGQPDADHVYCILHRAKTRIQIHNRDEAAWLIHSAYFQGDTCGLEPTMIRSRAAIGRLGEQIAADFGIKFTGGLWYNEATCPDMAQQAGIA